jgi:hypothetical protein
MYHGVMGKAIITPPSTPLPPFLISFMQMIRPDKMVTI